MHRHQLLIAILALVLVFASSIAAAQLSEGTRVTILVADLEDPRLEMVREAVSYWNRTFEELGFHPFLKAPEAYVGSTTSRLAENYARMISQRVGRLRPGAVGPPPPDELLNLETDVIVLLSGQRLMPFSWPLASGQTFIAISAPSVDKLQSETSIRNVVAHELGHAFGLSHTKDPNVLMCMPCHGSDASLKTVPPLTRKDRLRLDELYATRPPSSP